MGVRRAVRLFDSSTQRLPQWLQDRDEKHSNVGMKSKRTPTEWNYTCVPIGGGGLCAGCGDTAKVLNPRPCHAQIGVERRMQCAREKNPSKKKGRPNYITLQQTRLQTTCFLGTPGDSCLTSIKKMWMI